MEGKMNQDTLTEKSNFQSSELSDQELEQAVGGGGYVERRSPRGELPTGTRITAKYTTTSVRRAAGSCTGEALAIYSVTPAMIGLQQPKR